MTNKIGDKNQQQQHLQEKDQLLTQTSLRTLPEE